MSSRFLIGLAAAGIMFCACQSDSFQINGYARDCQDGDTICLALESDTVLFAQTIVKDGLFQLSGTTDTICLCRAFLKQEPKNGISFFLEPGYITIEFHSLPAISRVSGTIINNEWQKLSDSINLIFNDRSQPFDSLHRRMSDCIMNAAQRNKDNHLGRYIQEYYKKPEFK
jgi:hypothetical protein